MPGHPFHEEILPDVQPEPPQHSLRLTPLVLSLIPWQQGGTLRTTRLPITSSI